MNIHCCSFASESFRNRQNIQAKFFLEVGFETENIHLFNPEKLSKKFFEMQPNASESNKYGWYAFKPFLILTILQNILVQISNCFLKTIK